MPASVPDLNKFINATPSPPPPFNVQRLSQNANNPPIHPSTQEINRTYQKLLSGTVWQNYMLAMTQWPTAPNSALPGTPSNTFPGLSPISAYANTTMETWEQTNITTGCMNCHNLAGNTDFLWSPHLLASSPLSVALLRAVSTIPSFFL